MILHISKYNRTSNMMIQMNQELPIDISLRNGKLKPPITIQTNEI